jgi:ribonucleoside-diphosphate reductase alpha chain
MSLSPFAAAIYTQKYAQDGETWPDTVRRVVENVMGPYLPDLVEEMIGYMEERKFLPGGRYLYAAGKKMHQVQNCLLMEVEDSREGWANLMHRTTSGLMTGAGVGVVYSKLRPNGTPVKGMGGKSTGPLSLMKMVNEAARHIMQGGSRRAALWAGLHWNHADIFEFMYQKNWDDDLKEMKAKNFNFPAPMDGTNISIILDDAFFWAFNDASHPEHVRAREVYWSAVENMLNTGEPGFSVDVGANAGEHMRNACTEITSADDDDICNLGSINLARVDSIEEMDRLVELGTAFLLCGTLYSTVPYQAVADTRTKNRRLGLGIMGVYEWLAVRGKGYAPDQELGSWLTRYQQSTRYADAYADRLGISRPVKTRAIAPTGTIGILGETTTGIEPMFAAAYKRRYLKGSDWHFQYVVEPFAQRMADLGIDPDGLESAYDLARDPGRRLAMQAWVQQYVDHGIASTINLPAPDKQPFSMKEFGYVLMTYLPQLRGVTVYPDGARGGQPLTVVPYETAHGFEGFEYAEIGNEEACPSGVCGI